MNFKRTLLSSLNGTGIDQLLLRVHDEIVGTTGGAGSDVRNFTRDGDTNGAVIFPLIPGYRSICYRYCVLADAFRRRGYDPLLLVDDDTLAAPFERTADQDHAITAQTRYYRRRIPAKFGLETIPVSTLLSSGNGELASDSLQSIDFDRYARGSTRKHLKQYSLDSEDDNISVVLEKFSLAARRLASSLEVLFENRDISALVTHEPYYVQGGVPIEVANAFDTPAYSQVWGFRSGNLLFGRGVGRSLLPQYTDEQFVKAILSEPLSDSELRRTEKILQDRASGQNLNVDYSAHTDKSVETASGEQLVAVFTNLLWDASLEPEQAVYGDVFEWLEDTLDELGGREDTRLVIKTHPAEGKFGTNESVIRWFQERDGIPQNVVALPPDTDIDTYALLDETDVAIVYNSTVGLEAACRGVPVVVAGDTHYRGFGLTIDPTSRKMYRDTIQNYDDLDCGEDMQSLAKRYAHLLFMKRHVPFEYCQREQGADQQLQIVRAADTEPGTEPFDTLVSAITSGRAVLHPAYDHLSRSD